MGQPWNRNKGKALAKRTLTLEEEETIQKIRGAYKKDPRMFFQDCLRVKDRDTQALIPFTLNAAQESLLTLIERVKGFNEERKRVWAGLNPDSVVPPLPVNILVLKQRKGGVSTLIEGIMYHAGEFFEHTHGLCMAHRGENASYIAGIAGGFALSFPEVDPPFNIPITRNADHVIEWDAKWGSMIVVMSGGAGEGVARGPSFDILHISEVAHFQSPDAISAAKNAAMPGALIVEETTAKGIDHSFYGSWQKALYFEEVASYWQKNHRTPPSWNGKFKWFWGWHQDPGYTLPVTPEEESYVKESMSEYERQIREQYSLSYGQLQWRRMTIATKCSEQSLMDPEDFFRQEYPLNEYEAFVTSGNKVFSEARLIELERQALELRPKWHGNIAFIEGGDVVQRQSHSTNYRFSPLVIWDEPVKGGQYVMGVDTAEGLEHGDYTVVSVWFRTDGSRLIEAARYRGKLNPHLTGDLAFWLGRKYNNAFIIPEANNTGVATVQRLVQKQYEYLYHRKNEERVGGEMPDDSFSAGFKTYKHTKPLIIGQAQTLLREHNLCIKHLDAIQEFRIYTQEEGKYTAPAGCHDDCVMADALAIYAHTVAAPPVVLFEIKTRNTEDWTHEQWEREYAERIKKLTQKRKKRFERIHKLKSHVTKSANPLI